MRKPATMTSPSDDSSDIDVGFDFRRDTPEGKDPDTHSRTLRRYHQLLWNKPLPSGKVFELEEYGRYLRYRSSRFDGAALVLSSDTVIPTFKWNNQIRQLISQGELDDFNAKAYTIGGMMIFPAEQIGRKWTINQARGCKKEIRDRFDLTLECIRRHYVGEPSPLSDVLARYATFFELFENFRGYIEFFLLQDLVTSDYAGVKIAPPFDNFRGSPIPTTTEEYSAYKSAALGFIKARNGRIQESRGSAAQRHFTACR